MDKLAMELTLRPAVEAELSLILQWVRDSGINLLGLKWERFTMAETPTGEVAGFVQLKPHRNDVIELASLVVGEEWRGKGVARILIEGAVARHNGPLYLMCRSSLGSLYEKFGFHRLEENEMPRYYRIMSRLVRFINRFRDTEEYLLVMYRGK